MCECMACETWCVSKNMVYVKTWSEIVVFKKTIFVIAWTIEAVNSVGQFNMLQVQ